MSGSANPEGIERRHIHEAGGGRMQASPIGLLVLAALLSLAFVGWYGSERALTDAGDGVELRVDGPLRIRNGEFFELVIALEPGRALSDAVVLVGDDVWRDVTVNTLIPSAAEESYRDGAFAFAFGPLDAGERLVFKVDCQVNPDHVPGANRGTIAVADGDGAPIASVDYTMEVLP